MKPVILMVLDGWGLREAAQDNAIAGAPDRAFAGLRNRFPHTELAAHGQAVGLVPGQMGDSNVGHLTLGAGRIMKQNLARINHAIKADTLKENPELKGLLHEAKHRRLHVMGLLSPGGVHSHQDHLWALMNIFREASLVEVFYHLWLDGRDVGPTSAMTSLAAMADALNESGVGHVASLAGRYYAMDRDRRFDRTERAFRAMVDGDGHRARSASEALDQAYRRGESDEFVEPTVLVNKDGKPVAQVHEEDLVLVFNFRADRVRQITRALLDPDFEAFSRPFPKVHEVYGMTLYDEDLPMPHLFTRPEVVNNLPEWLSRQGLSQYHVAETEKYAHVTFFLNGGVDKVYPGEDRKMVPSPKVATYDKKPEMSAHEISEAVLDDVKQQGHDVIIMNFANSDMVGHSGKQAPTEEAVRAVDYEIGRIAEAVLSKDGLLAIVADHGNAEIMADSDGGPHTNHTTSPVPFVVVASQKVLKGRTLNSGGGLQDVAPTLLDLMGIAIPDEMEGQSLLGEEEAR